MSKLPTRFELYHKGNPPRVEVWCSDVFLRDLAALLPHIKQSDLANISVLVDRLASRLQLSQESFRKERDGYAFKAGQLRFYGAYSNKHSGKFVLSHPIIKRHAKLAETDLKRIRDCVERFDAIESLKPTSTYPS